MKPAPIERLTALVRRSFQRLRHVIDLLHADLGVTASMRAVLEYLSGEGDATVPRIAAAKEVSRQHIQKIVDQLLERELVKARANPGHRRSPLIALTGDGRRIFAEMRKREATLIAGLGKSLAHIDVEKGCETLEALLDALQPFSKGEDHEHDDE
jgi:DNA-binding MarR family transcriptional regulator